MLFKKSEPKDDAGSMAEQESGSDDLPKVALDSFPKIEIEIEKIKEIISSLRDMQKMNSERFTRVSEQIGELRSMILEREKESNQLEARIMKAIDLVEEVQPENFFKELKKQDAKLEGLEAKLEGNTTFIHRHTDELKQLRSQITVFRGLETVMKLNEEMKETYASVKKVSALVEQHSDRVAGMFADVQKKFSDLQVVSNKINELNNTIAGIVKDSTDTKTKMADMANKTEITAAKAEFESKFAAINHVFEGQEMKDLSVYLEHVKSLEKSFEELKASVERLIQIKEKAESDMQALDEKMKQVVKTQDDLDNLKRDIIKVVSGDQAILLNVAETEKELRKHISGLEEKIEKLSKKAS